MKNFFQNPVRFLFCTLLLLLGSMATLHAQGDNNMGIGTASPSPTSILDITSNTRGLLIPRFPANSFPSNGASSGLLFYDLGDKLFKYWDSGWRPVGLWKLNTSGEKAYYEAGNVGIGTSTPLTSLSVTPNADGAKITLFDGGGAANHFGFGVLSGQLNYHVWNTGASHVFYAGGKNGDGTELMRIRGNGNVSVAGSLSANGNLGLTNTAPTIVFQDTDNRSGFIHQNSDLMYFLSGGVNANSDELHGGYWPLTLNMGNDAATFGGPAYFMEGSVGIGTTDPLTSLSITPNSDAAKITLWDGGNSTNHFGFGANAFQLNYHVWDTGSNHVFYAGGKNGNGTELMRISGNGTVKIGNATDFSNQWLKVKAPNGNNNAAAFSNNSPADGAGASFPTLNLSNDGGTGLALFISSGTAAKPGGGSWLTSSDLRLKKDIESFAEGLESIRQVRPVWYRYNGKGGLPTQPRFVGVIAQELQKVAPHMVSMNAANENPEKYLMVDPSAFTYMLINAVKELDGTVQQQQQKIEAQQAEIDAIKKALVKAGIKLD